MENAKSFERVYMDFDEVSKHGFFMLGEELEHLASAFAALPPDWREVILLARVRGLSHAEIARTLGRTESATRTLLSRALARLATELEATRGA